MLYGGKLSALCSVLLISVERAHYEPASYIAECIGTETGLDVFGVEEI
jgi:hypothetical protein